MNIRTKRGDWQVNGSVLIAAQHGDRVTILHPGGFGYEAFPPTSRIVTGMKETAARAVCAIGGGLVGFFWHWLFSGVGIG